MAVAIDPFIRKLELKMQAASTEVAQAEYRAEMACYWARSGHFDLAKDTCQQLRSSFGNGSYPKISTLIMCAEGLIFFFRDVSLTSLDRLARANLLSRSLGINDVSAFSAAWMAHINFNFDRYDQMCVSIRQCFEHLDESNIAARGRVAIVLSDAFFLIGRNKESQRWFGIARDASVHSGDHTLVAALTYNRAALNAHLTQLRILSGAAPAEAIQSVYSQINSAIGYQRLAQLRSLEQLLHLALVGIHIFRADFEAGQREASAVFARFADILLPHQQALLSAQLRLCEQKTNARCQAFDSTWPCEEIEGFIHCDSGDRALILDCYAKVAESKGLVENKNQYLSEMRKYLEFSKEGLEVLETKLSQFSNLSV
jgi:hypothetical protein